MDEEYLFITNKNEVDDLMEIYFGVIGEENVGRAIERFSKKEGFGIEFSRILFQNDLDYDEEEYELLDGENVLLVSEYPAVKSNCEAILTFSELFIYMKEKVLSMSKDNLNEKKKLEELLSALKKEFNIR